MEWFDADLELKLTSGSTTVNQDPKDPKIVPYMREGVMGLMILSSFLDTTFGCFVDGVELGNTSLVIYPKYLVLEESQGGSCRKNQNVISSFNSVNQIEMSFKVNHKNLLPSISC